MIEENKRRVGESERREALEQQRKEEERYRESELIQRQKEEEEELLGKNKSRPRLSFGIGSDKIRFSQNIRNQIHGFSIQLRGFSMIFNDNVVSYGVL
ncbi:hypothetical protein MKX01_042274 [Papaver californicum]|nr:hypothetical protein MKX01_042274 [Papaver californicum]